MSRGITFDCIVGIMGVALVLLAGGVDEARALEEVQKLTASDAAQGDLFGVSVSVSGDTAVVGSASDDCAAGFGCGSAYIYRFEGATWGFEQKLTASDEAEGALFGISSSVSGDTVVVGASWDDCAAGIDCGSAYVFRFDGATWVEEQKLTASDAEAVDRFGNSVSVSGNTAVVGASLNDCAAGIDCGSAYVYRFDGATWVEEQKLTASDEEAGELFAFSLSLIGDTAMVGAPSDDCPAGSNCGSAYVFGFDGATWVQEQKLTASDAVAEDGFGASISVNGDTAVVGAFSEDCAAGILCGSVYVYRFDGATWLEEQKLTASDAAPDDAFGFSVSLIGDTVVVGAPCDDCAAGLICGSVYVYRFDGATWVEEQKLTASDPGDDQFGHSVSVSGDTVFVGAFFDECSAGPACGSAYVFDVSAVCGDGLIFVGEDCDPPDGQCCSDTCTFEAAGTACDDGEECTVEDQCTGEPDNDCAGEYQVQVFADICLPYDPPNSPQPNLDDILCVLDDFADGSTVEGCTCDGFRNTTDLHPCPEDGGGDSSIGLDDILKMLDAFGGLSPCDDPCP